MKTKLNGILTLLLALVVQVAFAQQIVTGKVTDPNGEAIFGATVQVVGTQTFTTTDFDGKYSIQASPEQSLQFLFTGYDAKTIVVGSQTVIDVKMETALEEVVIQAYRTTTKATSNIAVSSVTSDDIQDRPNANVIQRLQGQIPGLNIQTNSGQPGSDSSVTLRGPGSFNGNNEPLFILDGVPINEDVLRAINPNDIENITVLRDAAGTAIYGNRGANGVIIYTTKTGKFEQPLTVSYNALTTFSSLIAPDYNMYDARGILRLENQLGTQRGATLTQQEIDQFAVNTDWEDLLFQTGVGNQHDISIASGGSNLSQRTSIGYFDQEGTVSGTRLNRFTFRSNVDGKSDNGKFRFSTKTYLGYTKTFEHFDLARGSNLIYFNPINAGYYGKPYINPADRPAGGFESTAFVGANVFDQARKFPLVTIDNLQFAGFQDRDLKINVSGSAAYDITDELTVQYDAGADYTQIESYEFLDPRSAISLIRSGSRDNQFEGLVDEGYSRDFRFNSNLSLRYNKSFGEEDKHSITANAYLEYVKAHFKSFGFNQTGLNPRTFSPGDGAGFIPDVDTNDENRANVRANKLETGLFSYFGEFDYDYDQRFGAYAVLRRDNSFRFAGDNKWGTFFSGAVRWNISKESFMQEVDWVNTLKLRVSYGEVGNERILGGFYGGLSRTRQQFITGAGYRDNQTFVQSATLANPGLSWETIATTNIGIEYGLFDQRLRGTLDFYEKNTKDLFYQTQTSGINGTYSQVANAGSISNKGIELALSYDVIRANSRDDFGLTFNAVVGYNQNRIEDIDVEGGIIDESQFGLIQQEGGKLNEYFVVPYVGVNPANGNLLYLDINDNITENPTDRDRRTTGTSFNNPDYQGSFGINMSYKGFFVETQFNYITGNSIFDDDLANVYDPNSINLYNLSADLNRAWTPDNRITDIPSLTAGNLEEPTNTSRFLVDTDFLRWRFAQIGYSFSPDVLENLFLNQARVYINAENLITWTEFRGSDPERASNRTLAQFPTPRIIGVGLDLTF